MFCGTRNCSTGPRPNTPASESCTTGSLSLSAGSAVAAGSPGIGCEIEGSVLAAGAGAAVWMGGASTAGCVRPEYQYQPPAATAAATTAPATHMSLRRDASSRSWSHISRSPPMQGRRADFTPSAASHTGALHRLRCMQYEFAAGRLLAALPL